MNHGLYGKYRHLVKVARSSGGSAVCFSGGVDSALVLKACVDALPSHRIVAATAVSEIFPLDQSGCARRVAAQLGAPWTSLYTREVDDPEFSRNTRDRCYYCKKNMFRMVRAAAEARGIGEVFDGTNAEDRERDRRASFRAALEVGVKSPLREAGFTKAEVRNCAKALGLGIWDYKQLPCLASRVEIGIAIDREALHMVEHAEETVRRLAPGSFVRRVAGDLAELRVSPSWIGIAEANRGDIEARLTALGFGGLTIIEDPAAR